MSQAKPRRIWRRLLIILAIIVVVPVLGATVAILTLDTEALKPRVAAAVEAATGRRLTLSGPISFTTSIVPTIAIEDIALANAAGGSAPEMLTAKRIELRLALLPLLSRRIDIRSLTLVEPRLLLETDAEGRPNWLFAAARPAGPPPANSVPAPSRESSAGLAFGLQALTLTGGTITYRDGVSGAVQTVLIEQLTTRASARGLAHDARIRLRGAALHLQGETGTVAEFMAPSSPWPLRLAAEAEGMNLAIEGAIAEPGRLRGWRGSAAGTLDSLARVASLVPQLANLPPATGIEFRVAAHEAAGTQVVDSLRLALGTTDLGAFRPGLVLQRLTASAEAGDTPISLAAEGALGTVPLTLRGTAGTLASLQQSAPGSPMAVDLVLAAANAELRLQGIGGTLPSGAGLDLTAAARIPELASLAALAGVRAPPLRDVAANGRITMPAPGQFAIGDLRVTSSGSDVAGGLTVTLGARPGVAGTLTSERLDLAALMAPVPSSPVAAPALPTPTPVAPIPAPAQGPRRVIPEIAFNLDVLRAVDADLRLSIGTLIVNADLPLRSVTTHLVLREGRLALEPIAVTTAGGAVTGSIAADANASPPLARLSLRGDGLDLAALRPVVGERFGNGHLDLDIAVAGTGADTRALAASLDGHVAFALVDGRIPPALLAGIPPDLLRVLVPQGIPAEGLPLRCFAVRAPATGGTLRAETFLAESALGRVGATGTINLADERIDLRLLPDLRTGIINLRAPIPVTGSLAAPRLGRVDAASAAAAGLNALLGTQRTPDRTLEGAAEALGGAPPGLPDCAAALLAARSGRQGAAPTAPPAAAGEAPRAPNAGDILRGLLGGGRR
ncbi:MAG: hypothetical protein JWO24_1238 [Rhodospirillales bacterium]|nr:hypothetical protein [Rhodospirillales bacterium]